MKIAISGSGGFLGTNFIRRCKELDYEVYPILTEDLYDFDKLQKILIKQNPEIILHLAAYGNMADQKEPDMMVAANIGGTFNMLEASLSIPYKAFINIGSSSEYGEKTEPMSETDLPETDTFYGATKVGAGYIARAFAKQYKKPIINIRPFSVYGTYEADFRFIPTVIRSILQGTTFNLDEEATHDWVYVKDFVNAVLHLCVKAQFIPGEWVNVGTGKSYTNKIIVEMIETQMNRKADYKPVKSMRPQDSLVWQADTGKLSLMGFKPSYDIVDGLTETIKFYKKKYEK